jgi:hypothetical protein
MHTGSRRSHRSRRPDILRLGRHQVQRPSPFWLQRRRNSPPRGPGFGQRKQRVWRNRHRRHRASSDYGCGTVFELSPTPKGRWNERLQHSFTRGSDSALPDGGLIFDGSGKLYGTTNGDLSFAVGGVFELSPNSGDWSYSVLYSDNAGPALVSDKLGNLYGEIGPADYFHISAVGELSRGSDGWTYTDLLTSTPRSFICLRLRRCGTAKAICLAPRLLVGSVSLRATPRRVAG